jgi:type II secretory pathway component PulF
MSEQSNDPNLNLIYSYLHREIVRVLSYDVMSLFPKIFSGTVVSVVEAGEKGGSLEKNLLFIAETLLRRSHELNRKMKSAYHISCYYY